MKKIFTIILMIISLSGFSQKHIKEDSLYRFVLAVSYQPAINIDMNGYGIYLHNIIVGIGLYWSMDGLISSGPSGNKTVPITDDILLLTENKKEWSVMNYGLTIKTAGNFYIYCGFCNGDYTNWQTSTYQPYNGTIKQTYTVVKKTTSNSPGCDFGGIYYAGKEWGRFALQVGFNTSLKTVIIGIQFGVFFKKNTIPKS
jgi:hypothetical protein